MADADVEISTSRRRRRVVVDGAAYELADMDELPLAASIRLQAVAEDCRRMADGKLPEEEAEGLSRRLRAVVASILPALPADLTDRLTDRQRLDLLTVFCRAPGAPAPAAAEPQPASA